MSNSSLSFRYRPAFTRCEGFTLLELMMVCGLVAILLMFAVPGYQSYIMRGHRSVAIEKLLATAACEERIYALEFSFDTTRCLTADAGPYNFRIEPASNVTATRFTIVAEPVAAQRSDPCGSLILDQTGQRSISGPAERSRQCWEGR
ncbi:MAG TPA: type IV pilin protein [Xanthomonadales bacterium]|nr:type IV pilin protein [Xanthomonadales bacterium]